MIEHNNATRMIEGIFPYYVRVSLNGWMTLKRNQISADHGLAKLLDNLDSVCLKHLKLSFELAKQSKAIFFRMGSDIWTVGFKTQEPFDAFIAAIDKEFSGRAFGIKNPKHLRQLEEFRDRNWEILPIGLDIISARNTKFRLYLRKSNEPTERIEKFLTVESNKNEIRHLQTDTFHVLYFDNASLVLRAKLTFPNIDKIEHYINVDELGEANE